MAKAGKKTALVVDSSSANVTVLSDMMQRLGFEADEALSGTEAGDLCCKKHYDVVLMDYLMPGMDGVEATRRLSMLVGKEDLPTVIGVSGNIDLQVKEAFAGVDVTRILQKPVTMESLEQILRELGFETDLCPQTESNPVDIDSILSGVTGLNYEKGLEILAGNTESYMKVLSVCVKNIKENGDILRELFKDKESKTEQFALHFHSLKGIFLNVGADTMAERSKDLELAAKDGKTEWVFDRTNDYLNALDKFHDQLEQASNTYAEKYGKKRGGKVVSDSEFVRGLDELRQHIEDFEYIEITDQLEEMLLNASEKQKEGLESIAEAISDFDYDRALECLDDLSQNG